MKLKLLALMFALMAWSPSIAAEPVAASQTYSLAPKGPLVSNFSYNDTVDLADGVYTLKFIANGLVSNYLLFDIWLDEYTLDGNLIGNLAYLGDHLSAQAVNVDRSFSFTISNAADKILVWTIKSSVQGGNVSSTASIVGPTVAVPGPEAGAGLGALAMAGMGYMMIKRRRSIAA